MAASFKLIRPLLQTGTNAASRWFSYIGLGIGVLLLLCSIQMYINIQQLLTKNSIRKNGFDFISMTKRVTNETMGQPDKNVFLENEIQEVRAQKFIDGVAPLVANEFHVQLSAGGLLRTDLFLESLENDFIDTLPPSFQWSMGDLHIPVILSSDFLEAYNVFAPGQGLPQISRETAMGIPVQINCSGQGHQLTFQGNIVAFSDRVNSVLVPKNFLDWANSRFGEMKQKGPSRLFIKIRDADNADFLNFVDRKGYSINKDRTRFGRTKQTLQAIFSGLGIFGLLVVVMALLLFSFYLQLVIARSKDSLQLLLILGYSPKWLGNKVSRQFIPVYFFIVLSALVVTEVIQWCFHHFAMYDRPDISSWVHWSVGVVALALIAIAIFTNFRLVKRLL
ncbi:MAG TPA: hypothetical protein VHK91_02810, partial [Flavisolibacter sp.]|nr:hypothetical protein [Flavisolibacter sp.]